MPTYSYACTECGNRFDAVQAFTDDALDVCPKCSGRLRKLFGSVGVVFKGSGFYRTDSRAGSVAGPSNGDKGGDKTGEKKKSGASTESSADTSSATKSTSKSEAPAAAAS